MQRDNYFFLMRRYGMDVMWISKTRWAILLVGMLVGGFSFPSMASVSGDFVTPQSMERVSKTGFSLWQKWSRERYAGQKSAAHCMGMHAAQSAACWSALANTVRIYADDAERDGAEPYACQSVARSMEIYWLNLAQLADKAGTGHSTTTFMKSRVLAVRKDLRRTRNALREMADTGICPGRKSGDVRRG